VVKILAFLDLDQISADFEIEHFSKVSSVNSGCELQAVGYGINYTLR